MTRPIHILLQVAGKYDKPYTFYSQEAYEYKLKAIKAAMKATGDEYYVFLIRKSKGNRINKQGNDYKKRQKSRIYP